LRDQLAKLDEEEKDARLEIEQELRILHGRLQSLSRTTALEILTDNGLLPNYAFPERGVRFYGAIYNKHRRSDQEHKPIEVTRAAGVALKELAPSNHFYTHRRVFDIQQIAIGNPQDPLIFTWAICGACGHMRPKGLRHNPLVHNAVTTATPVVNWIKVNTVNSSNTLDRRLFPSWSITRVSQGIVAKKEIASITKPSAVST
jgi:hypothetical protein